MSFQESYSKERFSLLLLEPGEIYFDDYSCFLYPVGTSEAEAERRKQRGRLKVCSKSLLFDPQDICHPILKFPFRECSVIQKWEGSLLSKIDQGNVIFVECNQAIEMLEDNRVAPYVFKQEKCSYLFGFLYVTANNCLINILQLQRASLLATVDQASMIFAITYCRQDSVKFDMSWLEDLYEKIILELAGNKISPLVVNPGRVLLTSSRLYFQAFNNAEVFPVIKIKLCDMRRIVKRRFLLKHVGMELYCSNQSQFPHLFLSFTSETDRDLLYNRLIKQPNLKLENIAHENITLRWQNGIVSNYDYLLHLNSLADRSFNDLTQYPVFPWILSDHTSEQIDLTDSSIYRDLTKPIGALNEKRLKMLKERFDEMPEPKFLYGSHYSTPGFVLYYLVRKRPQYMLCLQNGRFDNPDRMFNSIADTWRNITISSSDFKELIPEFYNLEENGKFLLNFKNLNFGTRMDGRKVGNVELPPWAKGPQHYIKTLRDALESEYVSNNLNHWIDLIFGYKQRGEEAIKADNVFFYLTYEGATDLESITDANKRYAIEVQIMEFGQIPKQLFTKPHPQRLRLSPNIESYLHPNESSQSMLENAGEGSESQKSWSSKKAANMKLTKSIEYKLHKDVVTDVCITQDRKYVFSVSLDGMLKMYSLEEKRQLRSISIYNMALSSCFLVDDRTVIIGSWDNFVYLYNVEYGKILCTTLAHDDSVLAVHYNNNLLATASMDSTAKIWRYKAGTGSKSLPNFSLIAELDHDSGVQCVGLNSKNSLLVSGTFSGQIYIWELDAFSLVWQHLFHVSEVTAVTFSPDDQTLASCSSDATLRIIDVKTATLLFTSESDDELRSICWKGSLAIVGSSSGKLMIWDLVKAELLKTFQGHSEAVKCICMSPEGSTMVTGGSDHCVIVWKAEEGGAVS